MVDSVAEGSIEKYHLHKLAINNVQPTVTLAVKFLFCLLMYLKKIPREAHTLSHHPFMSIPTTDYVIFAMYL